MQLTANVLRQFTLVPRASAMGGSSSVLVAAIMRARILRLEDGRKKCANLILLMRRSSLASTTETRKPWLMPYRLRPCRS